MSPRYKNDNRRQVMSLTRERLVSAAVEEFAREGYEGANINRITQAAGVATGTIYNYFPSKNELMLAILNEIGTAHCAFIAEQVRLETDFLMRVRRLFGAGFDYVRQNPAQAKIIFAMLQGTNQAFRLQLSQNYQPMFDLISSDILIPGMAQGAFQPLDPAATAMMIMTFYLGVGSMMDENGETLLNLNDIEEFVLRALGAKISGKE